MGWKCLAAVHFNKYSTVHLGSGISVYFHLGVSTTIVYFKHGHRQHMTYKSIHANDSFLHVNLWFCSGTEIAYKLMEVL